MGNLRLQLDYAGVSRMQGGHCQGPAQMRDGAGMRSTLCGEPSYWKGWRAPPLWMTSGTACHPHLYR